MREPRFTSRPYFILPISKQSQALCNLYCTCIITVCDVTLTAGIDLNLKDLNPGSPSFFSEHVCACTVVCLNSGTHLSVWLTIHWPLSTIHLVHWIVWPKITCIDLSRQPCLLFIADKTAMPPTTAAAYLINRATTPRCSICNGVVCVRVCMCACVRVLCFLLFFPNKAKKGFTNIWLSYQKLLMDIVSFFAWSEKMEKLLICGSLWAKNLSVLCIDKAIQTYVKYGIVDCFVISHTIFKYIFCFFFLYLYVC